MTKLFVKLWPLLVICIFTFAFFYKLFFPLSIVVTPDYGRSDSWHLSIANKYYYSKELKKNKVPVWNNQIGMGFPILAEGQTGIFYLPNILLFRFFPFVFAYNLSLLTTYILAALGTYALSRSFNLSKIASVFSGLIFALSGFFIVHMSHLHLIQTASLLPWIFWAAKEYLKTKSALFLIYFSLILSQQIFTGFPQLVFYSLFTLFVFLSLEILLKSLKLKTLFPLLLSIILGLLLAAIQIFPTYEFLKISTRENDPRMILDQFPYKPENLIQFFNPFVFGDPKFGTYPHWSPGKWGIFWESIGYVGIIPLSLAIAQIISAVIKKLPQNKNVYILSALLILSILLSLGFYSPLYPVFSIPPFSIFRVPSRFLLISTLSLSLLSAFYLNKLNSKKVIQITIIVFSLINLYLVFSNYNLIQKASDWVTAPQTAQYLKSKNPQRILSTGQASMWNSIFLNHGWQDPEYYLFFKNSLDQNSNLIYGFSNVEAYESLQTDRMGSFSQIIKNSFNVEENKITLSKETEKLLTSFNVSHIISPYEIVGKYKKVFETEKLKNASFKVFEADPPPQRTFITSKYLLSKSKTSSINLLISKEFDPKSQVILEEEILGLNFTSGNATIINETPEKIDIKTESRGEGLLIIPDTFYPGWNAYIDKNKTEILPANINGRAVFLPEGKHLVTFKYEPKSLFRGKIISFFSLLLTLLLFVKYKNFRIS